MSDVQVSFSPVNFILCQKLSVLNESCESFGRNFLGVSFFSLCVLAFFNKFFSSLQTVSFHSYFVEIRVHIETCEFRLFGLKASYHYFSARFDAAVPFALPQVYGFHRPCVHLRCVSTYHVTALCFEVLKRFREMLQDHLLNCSL